MDTAKFFAGVRKAVFGGLLAQSQVDGIIADFVQGTFDCLEAVLSAIYAGMITTSEQVDAAAWPSSHD